MADDKEHKPLKSAGVSYVIGDAALTVAKLMESDKSGAIGAAMWGVGGVAAAVFGNPTAEKQLQLFERDLSEHLKKLGVAIPHAPGVAALAEKGGLVDQISSFLYTYPSEMLNGVFAVGGALTFKGAWSKNNRMDMTSGALITAGALAGLLIPEKKFDPEHPAQGFVDRAREWVQAKPLRVSGLFYGANNVPLAWEAIKKIRAGEKSGYARLLTASTYIFANAMLMLSSRDNVNPKDSEKNIQALEVLAEKAAAVVVVQPKEAQQALVEHIAQYLSAEHSSGKSAAEIAELLQQKLAETQKSTPADGTWQQRTQPDGVQHSLSL